MSEPLHPCVEALMKLAYAEGEECRWCRRFVGLDHARECPIRLMAAALSKPQRLAPPPLAAGAGEPDNGSRATDDPRERQHEETTAPGRRSWWRCVPLDTARLWEERAAGDWGRREATEIVTRLREWFDRPPRTYSFADSSEYGYSVARREIEVWVLADPAGPGSGDEG